MQISLRSQMIAGTAAIVGASAIAMTPVIAQHEMLPNIQLPSASAAVTLAGFDSPLTELIKSLGLVNKYINDTTPIGPPNTTYGLLPEIITDALPIIRQLGLNGSDYIYQSVKGLGTSAGLVSEGVWNAAGQALSGNFQAAITTLTTAIQLAGQNALTAGQYVLTGVTTRLQAVINGLSPLLSTLVTSTVNQLTVLVGLPIKIAQDTFTALTGGNFQLAWNTAVDGLLGPTGIPGVVSSLTIGLGLPPSVQFPAGVPSVRTEISTLVKTVKAGLATANPAPPPLAATKSVAASAAAAKAVAPSTAAVKKAAPAASATAGDNNGGGSSTKSSSSNGGSDRGSAHNSNH
jgi:hypothetical protein